MHIHSHIHTQTILNTLFHKQSKQVYPKIFRPVKISHGFNIQAIINLNEFETNQYNHTP